MLDSNFNAKLGDFGLARLGDHGKVLENTSIEGTPGYVAPEYASIGRASKGSDVFSFGSVALEIACGRKVIDRKASEDQFNLREWIWDLYGKGKLLDALDPRLNGEFDKQQVERLMIVGLWCAHPDATLRPTMEKAIHVLKFLAPLPDLPSEMPMTTIFASFSTSSGGTNLVGRESQPPSVSCNSFVKTTDNFSKQKRSAKQGFLAVFRGFHRKSNFGFPKGDFSILKRLQRTLKFGKRRETPNREKAAKRKAHPIHCTELPSDDCRIFSIADIRSATNDFHVDLIIGYGGFGDVYKGYIDSGSTVVAVKRLVENSRQGAREFQNEISILSKLKHRHVVSLIGYCCEENEMVLVYEYIARGTLHDHLHKIKESPLPWKQRLKICIGVGRGLVFLHTYANKIIIHRDIKSTNILLDNEFEAKISDFGISTVGKEKGRRHLAAGTVGYIDPEYYRLRFPAEKADVYSFGVVMLEILCAKPAIRKEDHEIVNLVDWAFGCYYEMGTLDEIIDPYLKGKIAPECFEIFTHIAIECLAQSAQQRPSMQDVLWGLERALDRQIASELQDNIASDVPITIDA